MFMWIIVIAMALALAAELFALVGMGLTVLGAETFAANLRDDFAGKLQPSIQTAKEFIQSHRAEYQRVRRDGAEIAQILSARFRDTRALWQDASLRTQRLRLRFDRESGPRVKQIQRDQRVVRKGVLAPVRAISSVALGVRSAAWLLRKVA